MELIIAALIIAFALVISTREKTKFGIKPRIALAQITVTGPTERGEETFQITGTLFADETQDQIDNKIKVLTSIRERRVFFCNQRMLEIMSQEKEIVADAEKSVSEAGISIVPPSKS